MRRPNSGDHGGNRRRHRDVAGSSELAGDDPVGPLPGDEGCLAVEQDHPGVWGEVQCVGGGRHTSEVGEVGLEAIGVQQLPELGEI